MSLAHSSGVSTPLAAAYAHSCRFCMSWKILKDFACKREVHQWLLGRGPPGKIYFVNSELIHQVKTNIGYISIMIEVSQTCLFIQRKRAIQQSKINQKNYLTFARELSQLARIHYCTHNNKTKIVYQSSKTKIVYQSSKRKLMKADIVLTTYSYMLSKLI